MSLYGKCAKARILPAKRRLFRDGGPIAAGDPGTLRRVTRTPISQPPSRQRPRTDASISLREMKRSALAQRSHPMRDRPYVSRGPRPRSGLHLNGGAHAERIVI
ncbi:hypothetical protein GCM10012280_62130 [Wenjunlia tyrosinilytica]|uniref:Uncharacterized protein n=1 Tax=Wenjunlia tyrosinilytica TaxID=1544741 RepID=A0A918E1N9_9ACTN|nr:hypothetical protein GCM10012280_62130 [Wenjunlia tyrosinilytica]